MTDALLSRKADPRLYHSVMLVRPDVPELVVVAGTEDEAFERAEPLLDVILKGYEDEGRPLLGRRTSAALRP